MSGLGKLIDLWAPTRLLERVLEERDVAVPEVARPFLLAGLAERAKPLFVVVPRSREAEFTAAALRQWREDVVVLPAWEVLPGEAMSPTNDVMGRRIKLACEISEGWEGVVIAPVRAVMQMISPPDNHATLRLTPGAEFSLDDISQRLVEFGFDRNYLVERPGEFSIRGGILDVFPPGITHPVRADFFGDEITSLRWFSVSSQRSHDDVDSVAVRPVSELLLTSTVRDRAAALIESEKTQHRRDDLEKIASGLTFPGMEAYLPDLAEKLFPMTALLPTGGSVAVLDPKLCRDRAADFLAQAREWMENTEGLFAEFTAAVGEVPIEIWSFSRGEEALEMDVAGWDDAMGRPTELAKRLRSAITEGGTVAVAPGRSTQRARDVLAEADLGIAAGPAAPGEARITDAYVDKGFLFRFGGRPLLALVGADDLFGRRRMAAAAAAAPQVFQEGRPAALILQLAIGDYVVHELYGVGRYLGMVTREVAGISRDYLLLEYAGDDRLYVPVEQLEAITKYTGGESPRLNRLGGSEWEKAKSRVRRAVKQIAEELVVLYARRMQSVGHPFAVDSPWQRQLEDAFPFVETIDQARAIEEVKTDMERQVPMDRLICGDVGYGKTEIAVRAAFKAVQDSKQVAVLVPTTILAQQHTNTFRERFEGFPIDVVQLSRFLTDREQREAVEKIAAGRADVVIGTHRLLQSDVKFHDLGLLIVDEEQRFGVSHKEMLKRLREGVDVLTLSATPIPRTLEMTLTGIRDMSLVDTPPPERRPVLTYVGPSDERMVVAAIKRELARDGQVFYVHNRVRTIKRATRQISALVPGARVEIAHGQMSESELERVMTDVWDGKIDVLVCTTIIESGLDIPAMNTLIVERADLLGLAQLYQLRGRVGRAGERAYAYLVYPDEAYLSDEAHERLRTLSEFTELGSGFKIAMRDLEIRGAGNLLGAEQSGHIAAVGFDLYVRMMTETVAKLSGTEPEPSPDVRIDFPIDAFVPASYVARESLRMEAYRLIEKIRSPDDATSLREELKDRYGPLPDVVENLMTVAELRALLADNEVRDATARDGILKLKPFPHLTSTMIRILHKLQPDASFKEASETLLLPLPAKDSAAWALKTLRAILA